MLASRLCALRRSLSLRRTYSRAQRRYSLDAHSQQQSSSSSSSSSKCVRQQLRELLRETAQPVAVVTSFMPTSPSGSQERGHEPVLYHGATLSSFTSIAMDPYPLITFSLRVPSRMATTLNSFFPSVSSASTSASSSSLSADASAPSSLSTRPAQPPPPPTEAHVVINILSASQSKHAHLFSRPDLFPAPFSDPDIHYTLSRDGLPVLEGVLGAMSCRLVRKAIPLCDIDYLSSTAFGSDSAFGEGERDMDSSGARGGGVTSELFIAQVTRIESLGFDAEAGDLGQDGVRPLLYHRRRYTSCIIPGKDP